MTSILSMFSEDDVAHPQEHCHIYGHGGNLGHVTIIMLIKFHFPVPKRLHTKFGSKLPSGI